MQPDAYLAHLSHEGQANRLPRLFRSPTVICSSVPLGKDVAHVLSGYALLMSVIKSIESELPSQAAYLQLGRKLGFFVRVDAYYANSISELSTHLRSY